MPSGPREFFPAAICALIMSCISVASCGNIMVVKGTVTPDSTLSSAAGWAVAIYSYREPPQEMPYLPPTGYKISESTCDAEGRYELQLNVDDLLARGITKIVVFAHPNPSGGLGWQVLEVKEGTYTVNLMASNLPALPSTIASTLTSTSSASSTSSKSTGAVPQMAIPGFQLETILIGLVVAIFILPFNRRKIRRLA